MFLASGRHAALHVTTVQTQDIPVRERPTRRGLHQRSPVAIKGSSFDTRSGKDTFLACGDVTLARQRLDDLPKQDITHICVLELRTRLANQRNLHDLRHQHFDRCLAGRTLPQQLDEPRRELVIVSGPWYSAAVSEKLSY